MSEPATIPTTNDAARVAPLLGSAIFMLCREIAKHASSPDEAAEKIGRAYAEFYAMARELRS